MKTATAPLVLATATFARSLFTRGTDFFGPQELVQAFGLELNERPIPQIPFTEEELTQARKLGQFLILHTPITMKKLHDQFDNRLGDGKLLNQTDWYPKENFYTTQSVKPEWKLVSREVIPGSTRQNYLGQTQVIADYVRNEVYPDMEMPVAYQAAITEFEDRKKELAKLMDTDWEKAAEVLASLKLNQLFRGSPAETLYTLVAYFKVNNERLLESTYHCTASRSSDGYLVFLGHCGADGVGVGRGGPGSSGSGFGVMFSRSAVPDSES